MYYLHILYSASADKYYVGQTTDPLRRLEEHNTSLFDTYTHKHRPWILKACFESGETLQNALAIERFIKKQKSRHLIEKLCDPAFIPNGILAQLVRVPHPAWARRN